MLPLSFKEYAGVFPDANPDIIYRNYIEQSSFPEVLVYFEQLRHNGIQKHDEKNLMLVIGMNLAYAHILTQFTTI